MTTGPAEPGATRSRLEQEILERAAATAPIQIIEAPRGAGKSTLLRSLARRIEAGRSPAALVDMERIGAGAASIASHLPSWVARAVAPAEDDGPAAAVLAAIEAELLRRKPDPLSLLDRAMSFPQALSDQIRRPLTLLVDEIGEVAGLARHAGLRGWPRILARRLAGSPGVGIVATASPASRPAELIGLIEQEARHVGRPIVRIALPPLTRDEVAGLLVGWGCPPGPPGADAETWMRATRGHPAYLEILARRASNGGDLAAALAAEMTPPHGGLHRECRFDYHLLIERSRGNAAVRSILQFLSRREGAGLSLVARCLGTALPTALDYLSWLLEVGLIRREGRGYYFADPLLKLWVVLNGPDAADPLEEVLGFLQDPRLPRAPSAEPKPRPAPRRSPPVARRSTPPAPVEAAPAPAFPPADASDRLMEID